jgi:ABC-type transporter Mla subunit MlaD
METGLILIGVALLLVVLFSIPILLKLWRAANDVTVTLQALNERLPAILKNMEEISANINQSTTVINQSVQDCAVMARRFHERIDGWANDLETFSSLALRMPLFRKMAALIPVVKGVNAFLDALTGKQKV